MERVIGLSPTTDGSLKAPVMTGCFRLFALWPRDGDDVNRAIL